MSIRGTDLPTIEYCEGGLGLALPDRVIRNPPALARSRQISQRRFQPELKKLASAQSHGMAVNAVVAGCGAVALAAGQIQKYPRM